VLAGRHIKRNRPYGHNSVHLVVNEHTKIHNKCAVLSTQNAMCTAYLSHCCAETPD